MIHSKCEQFKPKQNKLLFGVLLLPLDLSTSFPDYWYVDPFSIWISWQKFDSIEAYKENSMHKYLSLMSVGSPLSKLCPNLFSGYVGMHWSFFC